MLVVLEIDVDAVPLLAFSHLTFEVEDTEWCSLVEVVPPSIKKTNLEVSSKHLFYQQVKIPE